MCMNMLATVKCPCCGKEMKATNIDKISAKKYDDCIRKCETCEIGASNASENPTFIYKDYHQNIPQSLQLQTYLDETLQNALNKRNRNNKRIRIGYSTSEDALSWIFINYFVQNKNLEELKNILGIKDNIEDILMWGVSQIKKDDSTKNKIENICKNLSENPHSYSEPDIIIITKKEVCFIEVKLKSSNEKTSKKDFEKYLIDEYYTDKEKAKSTLYYELIRNWTIGNCLAKQDKDSKTMRLINLAPKKSFEKENESLNRFKDSLKTQNFYMLSWEDVFKKMKNSEFKDILLNRINSIVRLNFK